MRWTALLVGMGFLGCAHPATTPSTALTVDEQTAIEVAAFRAGLRYQSSPSDIPGDLAEVTGKRQVLMCLGVFAEASQLADPSPRVVQTLVEAGALVAPTSQCRNPGIQPPLLYDGSRVALGAVLLEPVQSVHDKEVVVDLWRGASTSLGASVTTFQHLTLVLVRTADGWAIRDVVEGAVN
ncbi:MAG: hypothetical protein ACLQDQ_05160 [Myxococcaceae bacterium]